MVDTDGPDGALHDYEIKYTFGVYPLQQYLIAMPGGRLQALGIAWDTRRERPRRPTVVLSVSRPKDHLSGHAALDRHRSELELHVRGLSFDQLAQELQRCALALLPRPIRRSMSHARLATVPAPITSRGPRSRAIGRSLTPTRA